VGTDLVRKKNRAHLTRQEQDAEQDNDREKYNEQGIEYG
jgi:hypothetical protein